MTPTLIAVVVLLALAGTILFLFLFRLYYIRHKKTKIFDLASKISSKFSGSLSKASRASKFSDFEPGRVYYDGNSFQIANPDHYPEHYSEAMNDEFRRMDESYEMPRTTYSKLFSRSTFKSLDLSFVKPKSLMTLVKHGSTMESESYLDDLQNMTALDLVFSPELIQSAQ